MMCGDPQEPDYRNGQRDGAKIYCNPNGSIVIHSFAHGGFKYWVKGGDGCEELRERLERESYMQADESAEGFYGDLPEVPLLVLSGQKMTGKTQAIVKAVRAAQRQGISLILYVATQTLANGLKQRLNLEPGLKAKTHMDEGCEGWPLVVTCPESAWKFEGQTFDWVVVDEAAETLRNRKLGRQQGRSRKAMLKHLKEAKRVILAGDQMRRSTVKFVERIGQKAYTVDRRRKQQPGVTVQMIVGRSAKGYQGWLSGLLEDVKRGVKLAVPCGSQEKCREIEAILKRECPGVKIDVLDRPETDSEEKKQFVCDPIGWLKRRKTQVLIYSPTIGSGVSIDGEYFDAQYEYVSSREPSSAASQRGERVRDVIERKRIQKRVIYVGMQGIPRKPNPEVFEKEYWERLEVARETAEYKRLLKPAKAIGGDNIIERIYGERLLDLDTPDADYTIEDRITDLFEVWAKPELLRKEWEGNGWTVEQVKPEVDDRLADVIKEVKEERERYQAHMIRIHDGVEHTEISTVKQHWENKKYKIEKRWGADFDLLKCEEFLAAAVVNRKGRKMVREQRLGLLVNWLLAGSTAMVLIDRFQAIREMAHSEMNGCGEVEDAPFGRNELRLAQLIAECPHMNAYLAGAFGEYRSSDVRVQGMLAYLRGNAEELAALTRHDQHITGLQYTPKTRPAAALHKLVDKVGVKPERVKKGVWRLAETVERPEHWAEGYLFDHQAEVKAQFEKRVGEWIEKVTDNYEMTARLLGIDLLQGLQPLPDASQGGVAGAAARAIDRARQWREWEKERTQVLNAQDEFGDGPPDDRLVTTF